MKASKAADGVEQLQVMTVLRVRGEWRAGLTHSAESHALALTVPLPVQHAGHQATPLDPRQTCPRGPQILLVPLGGGHLVAEPQHLFACPVGFLFRGLRPGLDSLELVAQLLNLRFQALKFFGVLRSRHRPLQLVVARSQDDTARLRRLRSASDSKLAEKLEKGPGGGGFAGYERVVPLPRRHATWRRRRGLRPACREVE